MKNNILCFLLVGMVFMSGCATIVSKSKYPVHISTSPQGVEVIIKKSNGRTIYRGKTPTTVSLKAGAGFFKGEDYTVSFKRTGYKTVTAKVHRSLDGWYIGNLLFGGFVGWLIVDPLTGAMWKLDNLHIDLNKNQAANGKQQLQILSLNEVPQHLRAKMVRIK